MMKLAKALVVSLLLGSLFFVGSAPAASASGPAILRFNTMVGIPSSLTAAQSLIPLRNIPGGGLPWMLSEANGSLTTDGRLKVEVQGLVLAAGSRAGTNPIPFFRALVSCVNSDGTFDNILTDQFPATTGAASAGGGDAEIETTVTLPRPCIAPIIFVTSPAGAWFAATGN